MTLYGRKLGSRYLIIRIGSQSMSRTIDPKTICKKNVISVVSYIQDLVSIGIHKLTKKGLNARLQLRYIHN